MLLFFPLETLDIVFDMSKWGLPIFLTMPKRGHLIWGDKNCAKMREIVGKIEKIIVSKWGWYTLGVPFWNYVKKRTRPLSNHIFANYVKMRETGGKWFYTYLKICQKEGLDTNFIMPKWGRFPYPKSSEKSYDPWMVFLLCHVVDKWHSILV